MVRFVFSALIVLTLASGALAAEVVDRIVAVVDGEIITLFDLNERLKPLVEQYRGRTLGDLEKAQIAQTRRRLLDNMINSILLEQEAVRLGIEVSDTEVENHIRSLKERNGLTEELLEEQLRLQKMTREEYKEKIRKDILTHRLLGVMVNRKVVVTQQEIEDYYEKHRADFSKDKTVSLGLVLLPADQDAGKLKKDMENGKLTFEEAAHKFSRGPGAETGGGIGALAWKELAPEWKKVLAGLKPGDISEPFTLNGHTALLKVLDNSSGSVQPIEDVRDAISQRLRQPKYERLYAEYLERLRSKAIIEDKL